MQPSFLFERSVLVTGEIPRTTGYEPGLPPQQAWTGAGWEPDPLVLDDQALIIQVAGKGLVVLADLAAMQPAVLVPAHCTGWRPQHAMSARFPDAFVPNSVGLLSLTGLTPTGCVHGLWNPRAEIPPGVAGWH